MDMETWSLILVVLRASLVLIPYIVAGMIVGVVIGIIAAFLSQV